MISILRRELRSYFDSLMGFGIIGAFYVLMMLLSVAMDPGGQGGDWFRRGELSMRAFFSIFPWVAAVIVPAVSMKLWAEDRRQSTFEMLMTLPIPAWKVALGKYFAGVAFVFLMLLSTIQLPLIMPLLGTPDWGPIIGGYVACLLLGAAFVAIGLFISGLTENQALAFFLSMLVCVGLVGLSEVRPLMAGLARDNPAVATVIFVSTPLMLIGGFVGAVVRDRTMVFGSLIGWGVLNVLAYLVFPAYSPQPDDISNSAKLLDWLSNALVVASAQISITEHFNLTERGVIYSDGLVFIVSLVVFFLLMNVWSIEGRRFGRW